MIIFSRHGSRQYSPHNTQYNIVQVLLQHSTGAAYERASVTKLKPLKTSISAFALSFSRTLVFPHSRINILLWDTCPGQFTVYVLPFPTYGNGHIGRHCRIVLVIRDLGEQNVSVISSAVSFRCSFTGSVSVHQTIQLLCVVHMRLRGCRYNS